MFTLENGINHVTMKWYKENLKGKINICDTNITDYNVNELENVIKDIMSNIGIGNIAITDKYAVVEGRKRIYAINAFINGEIKFSNKYYTELPKEEFDIFNNYELGIFVG
ncbi:MAG: hypothetical protein ACLT9M_05820 [Anaerobutyricum hallii]